jgi:hypothetical protein
MHRPYRGRDDRSSEERRGALLMEAIQILEREDWKCDAGVCRILVGLARVIDALDPDTVGTDSLRHLVTLRNLALHLQENPDDSRVRPRLLESLRALRSGSARSEQQPDR